MNKKDVAIALGIGGLLGAGILLAKKIQSQQSTSGQTQTAQQVEIVNVYVK